MKRRTFIGIAVLWLSLTVHSVWAQALSFTAIPDEDAEVLQHRFTQIATYLQQQLGIDVHYIPVNSYAEAVAAFADNKMQLAWFGGLSGVQARRIVPGSEAIAQGYEDQFFKSYFIAHHSSQLSATGSFPSLNGLSFTFGSRHSTSGRLMPQFFIERNLGKRPEDIFSRIGFSGDHSQTIAQVQSGQYQVGAVNYMVWESALAAGKVDTNKVKVIWESPAYPDCQWTVRQGIDQVWGKGFKQKLAGVLINMDEPELLQSFSRQSFVPAVNQDYQPIEDLARSIGLLP
ncbi:putative selenate ABC transporter substrate-binding protein [Shewanella sp. NFH-SH190041]|uniref:putative selenate ABC transporter substrate-binding protein n=1 Tax=Shewanella sp. NFH-SH190041 TaxID=2950245 RepID=UPI0021C44DF3|nr:putative selenate ABC transporter substrate-binding protein [Shewanella sp. NFH-SH190041]BDM64698.1 putative selenate ABC transporter substrate-binding protein [Shewanella sp. NFH-SH190041]